MPAPDRDGQPKPNLQQPAQPQPQPGTPAELPAGLGGSGRSCLSDIAQSVLVLVATSLVCAWARFYFGVALSAVLALLITVITAPVLLFGI